MGLQDTLLGTPGQTQVHQTGATRPPGYGMARDVYATLMNLANSGTPFPTFQGNLDPGLSPTLQNALRMAQGYSQSSPSEALSGINGVLGRFMNPNYANPSNRTSLGGSMPFSGQFRPNAPTYNGGRVSGYDFKGGGAAPTDGQIPPPTAQPMTRPWSPGGGGSQVGGARLPPPPPKPDMPPAGGGGGGLWAPAPSAPYTPPWAPPQQGGPSFNFKGGPGGPMSLRRPMPRNPSNGGVMQPGGSPGYRPGPQPTNVGVRNLMDVDYAPGYLPMPRPMFTPDVLMNSGGGDPGYGADAMPMNIGAPTQMDPYPQQGGGQQPAPGQSAFMRYLMTFLSNQNNGFGQSWNPPMGSPSPPSSLGPSIVAYGGQGGGGANAWGSDTTFAPQVPERTTIDPNQVYQINRTGGR